MENAKRVLAYGEQQFVDTARAYVDPKRPGVEFGTEAEPGLVMRYTMEDNATPPNRLTVEHWMDVNTNNAVKPPVTAYHDVYKITNDMRANATERLETAWMVDATAAKSTARYTRYDSKKGKDKGETSKTYGPLRTTSVHTALGHFIRNGHVVMPKQK